MNGFAEISESEFERFVSEYPTKLAINVTRQEGIGPPEKRYSDRSKKPWSEQLMGYIALHKEMKGHPAYLHTPDTNQFFIRE